jgi:hypothetical protein
MKRTALITYLSVPAVVTLSTFLVALGREPFGVEMFSSYVLGGYLFYAAPYLFWTLATAAIRVSRVVWHAGFIASSIALAAIVCFWLGLQDPSGLPLQWMLYWPLAAVLQLVIAVGTALCCRPKKSPTLSPQRTTSGGR